MFSAPKHDSEGYHYSPLFFLASLGAGGLAVTFFMIPMFWLDHSGTPIPTFENLQTAFTGSAPLWLNAMLAFSLVGVAIFSFIHFRLLIWNIKSYIAFKGSNEYQSLRHSNSEVQLMAIPLTYAMSINIGFILGALFVPGLWTIVEYLFPAATLAFTSIGIYGLIIFGKMITRIMSHGGFDCEKNNNLSQMLAIFAFCMIAVGLAAPAAMSHTPWISGLSMSLSVIFLTIALLLAMIKLTLGFRAMLLHGISREGAVSLWILIPILTLIGITLIRLRMGGAHNFGLIVSDYSNLAMLSALTGLQIIIGWFGYAVMQNTGYLDTYVHTPEQSAIPAAHTFSLICPGVAFFVLWNFLLNKGVVACGLLGKYDPLWFAAYIPAVLVLLKTIQIYIQLTARLRAPSQQDLKQA